MDAQDDAEFRLGECSKDGKAWRAFFVDSENGAGALVEGYERLTASDVIVVFHRGSFSKKLRTCLELGPAQVEWVQCVDPGVKNSMDVQIIAELSMRLAQDAFHEAYVISRDKGYIPAIHYLERHQLGEHHGLKVVGSINQAVNISMSKMFIRIEEFETREEIERSLTLLMGAQRSKSFITKMIEVFSPNNKALQGAFDLKAGDAYAPSGLGDVSLDVRSEVEDGKLTDLRGIGVTLSRKMKEAGVATPSKLKAIGAAEMWCRIKEQDPSFPTKWIYTFEAAINGISLKSIRTERRIQLKQAIKASQR